MNLNIEKNQFYNTLYYLARLDSLSAIHYDSVYPNIIFLLFLIADLQSIKVASPTNSPVRSRNARPGQMPTSSDAPSSGQNGQQVLSRKKRKFKII